MEIKLNYRTYHLVLRQLSSINKGIQAEHNSKRYIWKYKDDPETAILFDKNSPDNETTIILDGGVHQDMVEIQKQLEENNIKHTYFNEPDLNYCMTAITFIADERVWNKSYVDCFEYIDENECSISDWVKYIGGNKNVLLRQILENKRLSL